MPLSYNQIMATTLKYYSPTMTVNIANSNPGFMRMKEKNNIIIDGGERIVVPLEHDYNKTVTSFEGFDEVNVNDNEVFTAAEYNWKFYNVAITVALTDIVKNRGKHRLISFLESKIKNGERSLMKRLGTDMYGDGTGNGGKNMLGLAAIVSTTPSVGTLGGIDRSVATGEFWRNIQEAGVAFGASAAGRNLIDKVQTNIRAINGGVPDLCLLGKTGYNGLKKEFIAQEQQNDVGGKNKKPGFGYIDFTLNNMDVVFDPNCPETYAYLLSTDYLKLYILSALNFTTTDAVTPTNQHIKVSHIVVGLQMVASNCREQAVINGIS